MNTPTEDEREERNLVRRAVGGVLFNVSNFPEKAQSHLWGQNMAPLNEKITDAVLVALSRRTEVPELSADDEHDIEPWSPTGRIDSPVSCKKCGRFLFIGADGEWQHTPRPEPQGEPSGALTIPRPHVPYGPYDVPEHEADADYLDHAASNLEGRYEVGGSNVRATVVTLLRDTASALRAAGEVE